MLLRLATTWQRTAVYASAMGVVFTLTRCGLLRKRENTNALGRYMKKYSSKHYAKVVLCSRIDRQMCYKNYCSHFLVCLAWHGPRPSPRHQVDHIDRDRWNNRASNLRWVTPRENQLNGKNHLDKLARMRAGQQLTINFNF